MENPRPYDVIILYTVNQHCDLCEDVVGELDYAVFSFMNQPENLKRPAFYGVLTHSRENNNHFALHGFTTVPFLTVSLQ